MKVIVEFDIPDAHAPCRAADAMSAILTADRSRWTGGWSEGASRLIPGLGSVRFTDARWEYR